MATSQSQSLDNEKALVTGATSGIGRAIALQLAREGADVIVHGRDAQRGATVVQEIWLGAIKSARRVEKRRGLENLGPWDDFEWGDAQR